METAEHSSSTGIGFCCSVGIPPLLGSQALGAAHDRAVTGELTSADEVAAGPPGHGAVPPSAAVLTMYVPRRRRPLALRRDIRHANDSNIPRVVTPPVRPIWFYF